MSSHARLPCCNCAASPLARPSPQTGTVLSSGDSCCICSNKVATMNPRIIQIMTAHTPCPLGRASSIAGVTEVTGLASREIPGRIMKLEQFLSSLRRSKSSYRVITILPRSAGRVATTQDERWSTLAIFPTFGSERNGRNLFHGPGCLCAGRPGFCLRLLILLSLQLFSAFICSAFTHSSHSLVRVIRRVHAPCQCWSFRCVRFTAGPVCMGIF